MKKSEIFFSRITRDKQQLIDILGFNEGKFPIKYVRQPLSPTILQTQDCSRLIEVVESLIVSWKIKLLSSAGRVKLFQWGIMRNFNFWNLSTRLSTSLLKLEHIAYQYM